MFHDPGYFGSVDPVTFNPRADGEEVRIANRVPVAHDPRTPQELLFDQFEAFRHGRRHLALHRLDRGGIVCPPSATPAMRMRDVHGRAKIAVELLHLREGEWIRQ